MFLCSYDSVFFYRCSKVGAFRKIEFGFFVHSVVGDGCDCTCFDNNKKKETTLVSVLGRMLDVEKLGEFLVEFVDIG